jgi:hypothetical protein
MQKAMSRRVSCGSALILLVLLHFCRAQASTADIPVVINEIMAANRTIVRDPQLQYDDWVELYNAGDVAVNVGGMYLTDNLSQPTKWRIPADTPPATTIAAHGYLLIWTDGDTSDTGLHASFRLSDEGEEIGLYAADGVTLIDGFSFGEQMADVSYGRSPDGGPELQFLPTPTPGTPNVSVYEGIVEKPRIEPPGCLCTGPITVTMTTPTEGATIYYTINGQEPLSPARAQPVGSIYTGPITITRTTTLRVVALREGWRASPTRVERYVFVGTDLRDFTSPLPIVIVDTMGKAVTRTQTPAYGYFFDTDEQGRAAVTGPIDFAGYAGINIRGKSSEGFPKHQYHFETWDESNKDKDASILGLPAESDWVLQGPYSDKSLMRNVLAYQWSNDIGRYAPRTRFIELFLNTDDSSISMSDYVGVYVFMEKIKIGPNRVDVAGSGPADAGSPITGGYIIKKDKLDGDDVTFNTSRGQNLIYADPNGHDLTQQERNWIVNFFNSFEAALYGSRFTDPALGYAKFIDVDSFIDHHIVVELTKNIDGFRLSTYMYIDTAGKLHMGPVWDYNLSLGNADYLEGWLATGWYYRQLSDFDYPYWRRLFQDDNFKRRYAERWFELRGGLFTTGRLLTMIEDYATLIEEPQARNFARWPVLGLYIWPNWFVAPTWRQEIDWMEAWLTDRLQWMDAQIATEFAPAPTGR